MAKRKSKSGGKRRVKRKMHGASAFTDFFTKMIPNAARTVYNKAILPAHQFLKNNHVYSSALSLVPHPGAKLAGTVLRSAGYGRRQKVRMSGGLNALNGRLYLI